MRTRRRLVVPAAHVKFFSFFLQLRYKDVGKKQSTYNNGACTVVVVIGRVVLVYFCEMITCEKFRAEFPYKMVANR